MKTNRNRGGIGVLGFSAKNIRLYDFQAFGDALASWHLYFIGGTMFKSVGALVMESLKRLKGLPYSFQLGAFAIKRHSSIAARLRIMP